MSSQYGSPGYMDTYKLAPDEIPARPPTRGDICRGRPAAVRSNTPPRPSTRATYMRGGGPPRPLPSPSLPAACPQRHTRAVCLRGALIAAAVPRHCLQRRAEFPSPRRSSVVMFPLGYPCGALMLMSAAAAGLRSPSPPHVCSDTTCATVRAGR